MTFFGNHELFGGGEHTKLQTGTNNTTKNATTMQTDSLIQLPQIMTCIYCNLMPSSCHNK